jgi:predicted AAA+ superfamily ATPase
MIERIHIHNTLRKLMKQFPAIALVGARQTGKTTLARSVARSLGSSTVFFELERNSDRLKLTDAGTVLADYEKKCVIIDEAQTLPELFSTLRPLIDHRRKAGRFLLLGSVSPDIVSGISESLAGRIAYLELCPVNLIEAVGSGKTMQQLWFRGGYPEALSLTTNAAWSLWAENYFRTFVQRDVNFLMGETLSPSLVGNMWQMLAGINATILNYEMLARSLGISRPTVLKYLDFLESSFLIYRMQPWFINASKRVVRSPKIYFRDTGVLHYLNRVNSPAELKTHIIAGGSWEGFVVEQVRQLMPRSLSAYFYRTHHGAESDLVLVKGQKPVCCIEIKLSNSPAIARGWHEVIKDLGTVKNFVITPGSDDFRIGKNIRVCSLEVFLKKYLKGLI